MFKKKTLSYNFGSQKIIILLGVIISFFSLSFYDSQKVTKDKERKDIFRYTYENNISCQLYTDKIDFDVIDYSQFEECVISIKDVLLYVGDDAMPRSSSVIMSNSELPYPIVYGGYPSKEEIQNNHCVVLGKKLKKYTFKDNGNYYVYINKEKYHVTGFVSTNNSAIADYCVLVFFDNIGENVLNYIKSEKKYFGIVISFQSHTMETGEMKNILTKIEEDHKNEVTVMTNSGSDIYATELAPKNTLDIAMLIYFFSLTVLFLAIYYWYIQNRKMIAVMKVYGFSNLRIGMLVCRRFFVYTFWAIVFSICIFLFDSLWEDELLYEGYLMDIGMKLINSIKYIIITFPILFLYLLYVLYRKKAIEILRET